MTVFSGALSSGNGGVVQPGGAQVDWSNFQGSGVDVALRAASGEVLTLTGPGGTVATVQPPNTVALTFYFSRVVKLLSFHVADIDPSPANPYEDIWGFSSPPSGVNGTLAFGPCVAPGAVAPCIVATVNDSQGDILFPSPELAQLDFTITRAPGLGEFLTALSFDTLPPFDCGCVQVAS